MKKICAMLLIGCLSFCLIFFGACETVKESTNSNTQENSESEKVSTDHKDSSTGSSTNDDTDSSIDVNSDSDNTSGSDEAAVERYIKIHLQTEYYFQLNNRTITYTISGAEEFSIKENQLISTLNLPTPLISQLDKDEYYFSCWAYKDTNGKYHDIGNIVATDEIATDGIIILYPVSVPYHIGPF